MRVEQYRIAGYTWSATDNIFMIDIICEKQDVNNVLKRLKKRNKYILRHLRISTLDNEAKLTYDGSAFMWQQIEDEFPSLSDSFCGSDRERRINDPSIILQRKTNKPTIINGRQYFFNKFLGMMQVCLN